MARGDSLIGASRDLTARVQGLQAMGIKSNWLSVMDQQAQQLAKEGLRISDNAKAVKSKIAVAGYGIAAFQVASNVYDDVALYGTTPREVWSTSLLGAADGLNAVFQQGWPLSSLGLAAWAIDQGPPSSGFMAGLQVFLKGVSDPVGAVIADVRGLREVFKTLGDSNDAVGQAVEGIQRLALDTIKRQGWTGKVGAQRVVTAADTAAFLTQARLSLAAQRQTSQSQAREITAYLAELNAAHGTLVPRWAPNRATLQDTFEANARVLTSLRDQLIQFDAKLADPKNLIPLISPMADAWLMARLQQADQSAIGNRRLQDQILQLSRKVGQQVALTGTSAAPTRMVLSQGDAMEITGTASGTEPLTITVTQIDRRSAKEVVWPVPRTQGQTSWKWRSTQPELGDWTFQVHVSDASKTKRLLSQTQLTVIPAQYMPRPAHPLDGAPPAGPRPSLFSTLEAATRLSLLQRAGFHGGDLSALNSPEPSASMLQETSRIARSASYAALAQLVYTPIERQGPWSRIQVQSNPMSGFQAATYRHENGQIVVAFAGTDSALDVAVDVKGVFVPTQQQADAVQYTLNELQKHGKSLMLTGHSLGGALAQISSLMYGLNAVTFNSAALNNPARLIGKYRASGSARVINLYVSGEGVGAASHLGVFAANVGEDIAMDVNPGVGLLKHSIESVQFSIHAFKSIQDNYLLKPPLASGTPTGTLNATAPALLRPGQTLNLSGTFKNATGAKVVFTKPIPTESPISSFDTAKGVWSFNKLLLSEGQYSYDVVLLGKPDTIIYRGNVDVRAMDNAGGSLSQPTPVSVAVNTPWAIAGQFSGGISDIFVDFVDPASGATKRDRVNTLDSSGGRWSHNRSFPVVGNYTFKVIGLHPSSKAEIVFGSATVAVGPEAPGTPKVTAAQPTGVLKVGQPASFNVMGEHLNAQVPLTFGSCINPASSFRDSRNMVLSCTPNAAGPQSFGWKAGPGVAQVTVLRQFEVLPKDSTAPIDGMRLERETFPDNSVVDGGAHVDKSWTLQNTGSSTWNTAYCLRPQAGQALSSAPSCATAAVPPGQFHTFHAPLQMPAAQADSATVRQTWRLSNASGTQVGPEVWVQLLVKGNAPAPVLKVVEPFTLPAAVRAGSEAWVATLNLNLPASQVQMLLSNAQGQSSSVSWSPGSNAQQWQLRHSFTSPGVYNWTLNAESRSGSVQRNGSVQVLAPVTPPGGAPTMQFATNSRVSVGQPWELRVSTSAPAAAVRLRLGSSSAPLINLTKLSDTQFRHVQTFSSPGLLSFEVRASFQRSPLQSSPGTVQVDAIAPTPVPNPTPPVRITPILTVPAVVQSGAPWTANLRVDEPVHSASLVFKTGRRIQFDGGPQQWVSPIGQSTIHEAGRFDYQLELRRSSASNAVEMFPGGVLEVRAAPVPVIVPTITSALTAEQGQPYNLTVQTSASADMVTVLWPDAAGEQAFRPALDAGKMRWEFGNRLFTAAQPQSVVVRTYKDGVATPTGEARANLSVTTPAASLRLLQISNNVLKGEKPIFTVAASLGVTRVSLQLGNSPAQDMTATGGSGAEQNFRTQLLASQSGSVPYAITALNAQGQPVGNRLNGSITVAEPGDSLKAGNPVPAEIAQGQTVQWQFRTHQAPAEMWLEFNAPALSGGAVRQALTGAYFNHAFGFPSGDYGYRLMRRDHLGNVFPIQGAAGNLRIKPGLVALQFTAASANGQPISEGASLRFKTGELIQISVRTSQPAPRVFALLKSINWDRDFTSSDRLQWNAGMAGLTKGSYPATLYLKDLNYQALISPTPVNFNIVVEDNLPPKVGIQSTSANPASVKLGQPMSFSAMLSAPAAVQRAELLFPDANVTEPMNQTGPSTWSRTRPMIQAGNNRPYRVVLTLADGQRLQQDGAYTVTPVDLPLQFNVQANPPSVRQGQPMSFHLRVSNPALLGRAELVFPDANVTEPLTQTGPDSWTRSRTMVQAGNNRPFIVRLLLRDGSSQQAGGNYSVTP